ncbi:MAG TPA: sigma-E factor negative regulatory protein, partial [Macromonas sp.]|nr:sigma-E factor negative regulatory protein [Macromonas sp.]
MQTTSDTDRADMADGQGLAESLERLSALLDHQASAADTTEVMVAYSEQADMRRAWATYQQIGDVLREGEQALPAASNDFVRGVMARLEAERGVVVSTPQPDVQPARLATSAANDAVFRWKLVAGAASLAAVAAVLWQVAVPQAAAPGAQWAQASQPAAGWVTAERAANTTQAVVTPQGVLIRDPQLEALLAAHRQYGGQS